MKYYLIILIFNLSQLIGQTLDKSVAEVISGIVSSPELLSYTDAMSVAKEPHGEIFLNDENPVIQYGDFNKDRILDAVMLVQNNDPDPMLYLIIISFVNKSHPKVEFVKKMGRLFAVLSVKDYYGDPVVTEIIGALAHQSDDFIGIVWNSKTQKYESDYAGNDQ